MQRLNIYFIHSDKMDYNNLIYKSVLSSKVCLEQNIILPYTKENNNKYAKDLIKNADLIIADVSSPSFGLDLELKWLSKLDKKTLYISITNSIPKKYQKRIKEIKMYDNNHSYISLIEDFIKEELQEKSKVVDNVYILGEI